MLWHLLSKEPCNLEGTDENSNAENSINLSLIVTVVGAGSGWLCYHLCQPFLSQLSWIWKQNFQASGPAKEYANRSRLWKNFRHRDWSQMLFFFFLNFLGWDASHRNDKIYFLCLGYSYIWNSSIEERRQISLLRYLLVTVFSWIRAILLAWRARFHGRE